MVTQFQHPAIGDDELGLRGRGALDICFRGEGGISRAYQSGCLRMRLARVNDGPFCHAILLNTAGGLCDGDRLDQRIAWADGASALVTTQAAEKAYRSPGEGACITTKLTVGAGARAEWLPQETILFNHARLRRSMEVHLATDASFLGCETVVMGRAAMGETVEQGLLDDRWRIWHGGRLIYADAQRLEGPIAALMARAPVADGAGATGFLLHASSQAASLLAPVRSAIEGARGLIAASHWGSMLTVRLLARDGAALHHDLSLALSALRGGRPNPRSWGC